MIDLHSHSSASDGSLRPAGLVAYARSHGLSTLALTDHDSIDGLKEAWAESETLGLEFIPGIELEIAYEPGTFHLLGLGIYQYTKPELLSAVRKSRELRAARNREIVASMQRYGIEVGYEEMIQFAGHESLGRPHFAHYLLQTGHVKEVQEAFDRFLAPGRPFYHPRAGLGVEEAIHAVHAAGGLSFVAHPLSLRKNWGPVESLLKEWKELGLDGVETYHSGMSYKDGRKFAAIAKGLGLLESGGSDFHRPEDRERKIGRTCLEGRKVPPELADPILARR